MCYKVSSSPWPNNETDLSGVCTSCFGLQSALCQHPYAKNLDSFHITFRCQEFRPHCLATISVSHMDSDSTPTFWMHYLWFLHNPLTFISIYCRYKPYEYCCHVSQQDVASEWSGLYTVTSWEMATDPTTKKLNKTTVNTKQTSQYPG